MRLLSGMEHTTFDPVRCATRGNGSRTCRDYADRAHARVVKDRAGPRLALPLKHAAFPRNAAQLRELGPGYTNCAPTPEARLLRSFQDQAAEQRKLLG